MARAGLAVVVLVLFLHATLVDSLRLTNGFIDTSFDAGGNLISIEDSRSHQQHNISNDGWSFVVDDLAVSNGCNCVQEPAGALERNMSTFSRATADDIRRSMRFCMHGH